MAGVQPKDVDCARLSSNRPTRARSNASPTPTPHARNVTPTQIAGAIESGGSLPSNTAGGLISEGHLSGFGHIREGVRQVRGTAGERQVDDCELCLVTGYGGAPHEAPPTVSYSALLLGR
jgi:hypothetical protein